MNKTEIKKLEKAFHLALMAQQALLDDAAVALAKCVDAQAQLVALLADIAKSKEP